MDGFWIALIVALVLGFVLCVVKMGLKHQENTERIKHGYPLLDGTRKTGAHEDDEILNAQKERLQ